MYNRRKDGFFRPSGACREFYSNILPTAYAVGYGLSPATRAGTKSRGPSRHVHPTRAGHPQEFSFGAQPRNPINKTSGKKERDQGANISPAQRNPQLVFPCRGRAQNGPTRDKFLGDFQSPPRRTRNCPLAGPGVLGRAGLVIALVVPVVHPLPNIPQHVVEPKAVGALLGYFVRLVPLFWPYHAISSRLP